MEYLDAKMQEIRQTGKVIGSERVAVMAALNITHELLSMRLGQGLDLGQFRRRVKSMAQIVDEAMEAQVDLF